MVLWLSDFHLFDWPHETISFFYFWDILGVGCVVVVVLVVVVRWINLRQQKAIRSSLFLERPRNTWLETKTRSNKKEVSLKSDLSSSSAFSRISTSLPRRTSAVPFCCCCSRSCRKNPDLRNDVPLFVFARYCRNKLVHCYCCYYCYYPLLCSLSSGISPCSEVSEELCDPEWKR